jgi:hypothetical protein
MGLSDKINGSSKLGQVARLTACQVADQIEGVSVVTILTCGWSLTWGLVRRPSLGSCVLPPVTRGLERLAALEKGSLPRHHFSDCHRRATAHNTTCHSTGKDVRQLIS